MTREKQLKDNILKDRKSWLPKEQNQIVDDSYNLFSDKGPFKNFDLDNSVEVPENLILSAVHHGIITFTSFVDLFGSRFLNSKLDLDHWIKTFVKSYKKILLKEITWLKEQFNGLSIEESYEKFNDVSVVNEITDVEDFKHLDGMPILLETKTPLYLNLLSEYYLVGRTHFIIENDKLLYINEEIIDPEFNEIELERFDEECTLQFNSLIKERFPSFNRNINSPLPTNQTKQL